MKNNSNKTQLYAAAKRLTTHQKQRQHRKKANKQDNSKLKSFCVVKETISTMKRQPTKWKKIFVNHI